MFTLLLDLFLPTRCVGCGRRAFSLCPSCAAGHLLPRRHRPTPCPPGLPQLWAGGVYSGVLRDAILEFKERGRRELATVLGGALASAVRPLVGRSPPAVWLVPVPSRRAAVRSRGDDHVLRLARSAVRSLRGQGLSVEVRRALTVTGRPKDQVGMSAAERARNVSGAFSLHQGVLRRRAKDSRPGRVLLVDDIATTGATLTEAAATLRGGGVRVVGAAVVAATQRQHPVDA